VPVRKTRKPAARFASWILLAISFSLLGYVGFSLVDAEVVQAYESWRFNRALDHSHAALTAASPKLALVTESSNVAPQINVAAGEAVGKIEISRLGISAMILEGTQGKTLRRAVGHISGTAFPGEQGNVGIAGHRDTFFRELRNVQQNDDVILSTINGTYIYRVDSIRVLRPEDADALYDSGEAVLTLVTCYPFYFVGPAPERFVVRAHRI
jgi:sortase A